MQAISALTPPAAAVSCWRPQLRLSKADFVGCGWGFCPERWLVRLLSPVLFVFLLSRQQSCLCNIRRAHQTAKKVLIFMFFARVKDEFCFCFFYLCISPPSSPPPSTCLHFLSRRAESDAVDSVDELSVTVRERAAVPLTRNIPITPMRWFDLCCLNIWARSGFLGARVLVHLDDVTPAGCSLDWPLGPFPGLSIATCT